MNQFDHTKDGGTYGENTEEHGRPEEYDDDLAEEKAEELRETEAK